MNWRWTAALVILVGATSAVIFTTKTDDAALPAIDQGALSFFDDLTGTLEIELTEPEESIEGLENKKAPPSARLKSLRFHMQVYENEDFRELTAPELARVVFRMPRIGIRGYSDDKVIEHDAPDGKQFTVKDLWHAVEVTERRTRGDTEWFGGIDVHHVFYEGLSPNDDGTWSTGWGS